MNPELILTGPACVDCDADAEATIEGNVIHLTVRHDDTCPAYSQAKVNS